MIFKIRTILFMTLTFFLLGCAKEREAKLVQGHGVGLYKIADFKNKSFFLKTKKDFSINRNISHANKFIRDGEKHKVVSFSKNIYLDGIKFLGEAEKEYEIKFDLGQKYLILNRVENDFNSLSFSDQTYAKNEKNSALVPMAGYYISLYKLVHRVDGNGDKTTDLVEMKAGSLEDATHFRFDINSRILFDKANKQDVFEADYFKGEWMYSSTIVETSLRKSDAYSKAYSYDKDYKAVSRIHFFKDQDRLYGLNSNIDDDLDQKNLLHNTKVFEVPISWVDYKVKSINGVSELKEEVLDDYNPESPIREKRKFIKIDFEKIVSVLSRSHDRNELLEIEFYKNYFSFIVFDKTRSIKIKYAFLKAPPVDQRKSKVYLKDDWNVFGVFKVLKHKLYSHNTVYKDDVEKLFLMSRFIPENGKITYHFTKNTPRKLRDVGRKSVELWNKEFEKINSNIKIEIDESKDVSLGDIRYNAINLVDSVIGGRANGYGPSLSDTKTGETISATANVFVNAQRNNLMMTIRDYLLFRKGKFGDVDQDSFNLVARIDENLGQDENFKTDIFESYLDGSQSIESMENELDNFFEKLLKNGQSRGETTHIHDHSQCQYKDNHKKFIETITKGCGNQIDQFLMLVSENDSSYLIDEGELVKTCANKILNYYIQATLVHEIGHNLGLRHNFSGSYDKKNFPKDKKGNILAHSSSIMDYIPVREEDSIIPGPYDTETLRFLYLNEYKLKNGKVVKIDTSKSLKEQGLLKKGKEYLFCTDEDIRRKRNPMCQRHDVGTSPLEIVEDKIGYFKSLLKIRGQRHGRFRGVSKRGVILHINTYILSHFRQIYEYWRYGLYKYMGENGKYLNDISSDDFSGILEDMKNDPGKHGKHYREYYPAVERIFSFMLEELAFSKTKGCHIENLDNGIKSVVDFELIKMKVENLIDDQVKTCFDPLVSSYIKDKYNAVVLDEYGKVFNSVRSSSDEGSDEYDRIEIMGLKELRLIASVFLSVRRPVMAQLKKEKIMPNFFDNPIFRSQYVNKIFPRILDGIKFGDDKAHLVFYTEKSLLAKGFTTFVMGLGVPENQVETLRREDYFKVLRPTREVDRMFTPEKLVRTNVSKYEQLLAVKGSFGENIIKKRNEIKLLKESVERAEKYKGFDEVTIEKFRTILSENFLNIIELPQVVNKMNFREFRSYVQKAANACLDYKKDKRPFYEVVCEFFEPEVKINSDIKNNEKLRQLPEAELDKLNSRPANQIFAKLFLKNKETEKFRSTIGDRYKNFKVNLKKDRENANKYLNSKEEYDSQFDLLTYILTFLSKYLAR